MDRIYKYKYFDSSEEFEKWQEENDVLISQLSPIALKINAIQNNRMEFNQQHPYCLESWIDSNNDYGIFVVYSDKPEKKGVYLDIDNPENSRPI